MIRIPSELEGARLNITQTAELVHMNVGHFRRLVRRGVLPPPKKTAKKMPYFDYELICQIGQVFKAGVGVNGEEISFYRRKTKQARQREPRKREKQQDATDPYLESVIEGCKQLGVDEGKLTVSGIKAALTAEFGNDRPSLDQAIPTVARRLLDAQGQL